MEGLSEREITGTKPRAKAHPLREGKGFSAATKKLGGGEPGER